MDICFNDEYRHTKSRVSGKNILSTLFSLKPLPNALRKKKTRQLIYLTGIMTTNRRFLNISDVYLIQYSILKPISFSPIQNLKTDLHLVQYGFLKPIFNLSKREFKTIFLFSPIKNLKKNIDCDIHLAGHVQLNITFVLLIIFFYVGHCWEISANHSTRD